MATSDTEQLLYEQAARLSIGRIVIVEGKKDKSALQKLGVKNIVTLTKPLYLVIEEVAAMNMDVAILTDLDKEGKALYGKLSSGLQSHGVTIDDTFRNFLFKNTKLRQIEGILNYFNR